MIDYKNNSDNQKQEKDKKLKPVVTGKVTAKKRSGVASMMDNFVSEDAPSIKNYILSDILIPTIKKTIADIVTNGIEMILWGATGGPRRPVGGIGSRVSYGGYYNQVRGTSSISDRHERLNTPSSYEDIVFASRVDADRVLDSMQDVIDTYGMVSILEYYDLADYSTTNYTLDKYGWTSLARARVERVRDGYIIRLPRAIAL